jgi:hypothetical protein
MDDIQFWTKIYILSGALLIVFIIGMALKWKKSITNLCVAKCVYSKKMTKRWWKRNFRKDKADIDINYKLRKSIVHKVISKDKRK